MAHVNIPQTLQRPDGVALAYHYTPGRRPGVVFCGGLKSDMTGTKATALEAHCRAAGRAYLRFDYRGHGQSSGMFVETTVGDWAADATAMLDEVAEGPQVLVGSSMGGWIMLLVALARPERVAGLIGIAAAPDFVERMWDELSEEAKDALRREGVYRRPSDYSEEPYAISLRLIEEGRRHLLLKQPVPFRGPVRLLHGMRDPDVPWQVSLDLAAKLESEDVAVTLVKEGDHRLSTPDDIARLLQTVETLAKALENF